MPVPIPRWQQFIGWGKESAWNTPVAVTTFWPLPVNPKHRPRFEKIEDDGLRGTAARLQAWYQGVGWTDVDYSGMNFYPDDSGVFLMALLGTDAVTGVGPFTHTMTLLNTAYPPSYTGARFTGLAATAEQVGGIYATELTLKFVNPGKLTVDVKGKGVIQGTVTKPTNVYSTQQILLPWQGSLTLGGLANVKLLSGTISLKRTNDQIFGLANQQSANASNVDQITVDGKLEFWSSDMTELNYWLNNTQPTTSLLFTSGTNTMTLQMTKTAFSDPTELDTGTPYWRTQASFEAVANATDGSAPLKVILVNPRSTSY